MLLASVAVAAAAQSPLPRLASPVVLVGVWWRRSRPALTR